MAEPSEATHSVDVSAEVTPESQEGWAAELAVAKFTYTNERLQDAAYLAEEFPPAVELDDMTEFAVWTVPKGKHLTMDGVREAMVKDGITPASPQHGPSFFPEQEDHTTVRIPQHSKFADRYGDHQVAYLSRNGQGREFCLHWSGTGLHWSDCDQFLGVRTKPSGA